MPMYVAAADDFSELIYIDKLFNSVRSFSNKTKKKWKQTMHRWVKMGTDLHSW